MYLASSTDTVILSKAIARSGICKHHLDHVNLEPVLKHVCKIDVKAAAPIHTLVVMCMKQAFKLSKTRSRVSSTSLSAACHSMHSPRNNMTSSEGEFPSSALAKACPSRMPQCRSKRLPRSPTSCTVSFLCEFPHHACRDDVAFSASGVSNNNMSSAIARCVFQVKQSKYASMATTFCST